MVKEDQGSAQGSAAAAQPRRLCYVTQPSRLYRLIGAMILSGLMLSGIGCGPKTGAGQNDKPPSRLFHDWPQDRKPLFVLLLSGQQHGYLQPCGCSPIQYGGLERRYNLIQQLKKEKGWPIVAVDLGDIPQERGPQKLLKYVTSMEALKKLDYTAAGIGANESNLPLIDALAGFALNNEINNKPQPPFVLGGNLQGNRANNFPGTQAVAFAGNGNGIPKIGVTSVAAPSVTQQVKDPGVKFDPIEKAIPVLLKELNQGKADFKVLLFQGDEKELQQIAAILAGFQVILHLSQEEEPPENPTWVNRTMLVTVGHKGRYVGLVGVFAGNKPGLPFELYYQLLRIGPEYKTLPDKDADNPILRVLDDYAREVKEKNYLQLYTHNKHPIQIEPQFSTATYVGSDKCKKCHEHAYDVWSKSKHARAFQTLVEAKRPSLRQFDGECVICHVTGFEYTSGYRNDTATPNLKNVGCESCHGPGSEHVDNKNRKPTLLKLMNPFKAPPNENQDQKIKRMQQLNTFCQHCHDVDNDVGWNEKPIKPGEPPHRWHDIIHMTPKD
jgi:hypothetical protein